MIARDDPRLLTPRDHEQIEAFREFLQAAGPNDPDDGPVYLEAGLYEWALGEGPPPARLDELYGVTWRCAGMGV